MKKNLLLITILFACGTSIFAQVPSYVPTNGLVGWWPFNGNANDESGNGNNGVVNGAALVTDRFGSANSSYSFNGNNWIEIPSSQVLNIQEGTINAWFKTVSTSEMQLIKMVNFSTWQNEKFGLKINMEMPFFSLKYNSNCQAGIGWNTITSNNSIADGTWHMYTGTVNGSEFKVFIDGIELSSSATANQTIDNCLNNIQIGRNISSDTDFFFGEVDDIGIWNRALTECEILDLYNTQLGTSSTVNETACENYTWNGTTYSQSGQYSYQTTNVNGCDSTVTLNLTINQPSSSTQNQISLDSYTWTVNNQTYTQSGTYTAVIPNAAGCDSTITLNLTLSFTGIDEQENSKIIISPNPAIDYFMVIAPEELIGESYSIIDLNGKTLKKGTLMQKEQKIEIGNLSEGMYMFKINNETEQTFRIIKN